MLSEAGADAATTNADMLLSLSSSSPRGMRDGVGSVCASPEKGQNLNREPWDWEGRIRSAGSRRRLTGVE